MTARHACANASDVVSAAATANQEGSDDDYFGFIHNSPTEETQPAGANKLELEILQYLDDTRREIGILHMYPIVSRSFFLNSMQFFPPQHPLKGCSASQG
jgi:hypothetical protein